MKHMKMLISLALALCMVLCLVACGNNASNGSGNGDASVDSTSSNVSADSSVTGSGEGSSSGETVEDGRVTYTITVVDEDGNPISGAMVQICKDTCLPCGATNADGVVTVTTVEDDYKVSFMTPVAGYVTEGLEFYFDEGSTEMLIILTAE